MARRPVFVASALRPPFVQEHALDFRWHPGLSRAQALRSINSLHDSARVAGLGPCLEVSTRSPTVEGVQLSAFNLRTRLAGDKPTTIECLFQGSKVFERGGPFHDIYGTDSRAAKSDPRLRDQGRLIEFSILGKRFPSQPTTAFYDWIYCCAIADNAELAGFVRGFKSFTDIAFNPKRSINCQARALAMVVGLLASGHELQCMADFGHFCTVVYPGCVIDRGEDVPPEQRTLFPM